MRSFSIFLIALFTSCMAAVGERPLQGEIEYSTTTFEKEWRKIDSLLNQQALPRSVEKELDILYPRVLKDNNPAQVIKCLIYKQKVASLLSEDGPWSMIPELEEELVKSEFPVREILSSVLAELYSGYFDQNSWEISQRKHIEVSDANFEQWTLKQFNERIIQLLVESVQDDRLQNVALSQIKEIVVPGKNFEQYEHSLYDFLAGRAIQHFSNGWRAVSRVESPVELDNINVYSLDNIKFRTALKLVEDKEQYPYWILKTYHSLENFFKEKGYEEAYLVTQLKRIQFVRDHYTGGNNQEKYLNALENLKESARGNVAIGQILYELGNHYWMKSNEVGIVYGQLSEEGIASKRKQKSELILKARDYAIEGIASYIDSKGYTDCKGLLDQIDKPEMSVSFEQIILPQKPSLMQVSYRQLEQVTLNYYKLGKGEWKEFKKLNWQDRNRFLINLKIYKKVLVPLRKYEDYLTHKLEISNEGLEAGHYILSLENLKLENRNYTEFQVSNLDVIEYSGLKDGWKKIQVVDRTTGYPKTGVKVEIESFKHRKEKGRIKVYYTDDQGFLKLKLAAKERHVLSVIDGDDVLSEAKTWHVHYGGNHSEKKRYKSLIFTDRAIYRPGQTVHFKAVILSQKGGGQAKIESNTSVEVKLFDVQRQKLLSHKLKTNGYGSVHGHFTLPEDGLNGQYSIRIPEGNGYHSFQVEAYKRPTFELELNKPAEEVVLGDIVELNGTAMTYSGTALANADLSYKLYYKYANYHDWRCHTMWSSYMPWSQDILMGNGKLKVDQEGKYTLTLSDLEQLPDFLKHDHLLQFRVEVKATDISGETQETSQTFVLGEKSLQLSLNSPKYILKGQDWKLNLSVKNYNNEPLSRDVKVRITGLKVPNVRYLKKYWHNTDEPMISSEEYRKKFPDYAYGQEADAKNWPRLRMSHSWDYANVTAEEIDLEYKKIKPGAYILEAETKDKNGQTVIESQIVYIYGDKGKEEAFNHEIVLFKDKETYEVGEHAQLKLILPKEGAKYRMIIQAGDGIIQQEVLNGGSVWSKDLLIKENYKGNVYLSVQSVYSNRLFHTMEPIRVPWSDKELKMEWISFRDKLKPGEKEKWKLKITGSKGEQVQSELALTMYDASLDAFYKNNWTNYQYPISRAQYGWLNVGYTVRGAHKYFSFPNRNHQPAFPSKLNLFNLIPNYYRSYGYQADFDSGERLEAVMVFGESNSGKRGKNRFASADGGFESVEDELESVETVKESAGEKPKQIRKNFAETVFFYPQLETDEEGNVLIDFTMVDAISRFRILGYGHTKGLDQLLFEKEVISKKELLGQLYTPRFFRQGDDISLSAKLSNLSEKDGDFQVKLELFNAITMHPITWGEHSNKDIHMKAGEITSAFWNITVPDDILYPVKYRLTISGAVHSDIEEGTIPVLSNRILVKESLAVSIPAGQKKQVTLKSLKENKSKSLSHHLYKVESTSNPVWYAIQSLPYLMDQNDACSEQLMAMYFSNRLANRIVMDNPSIRTAFELWKKDPKALQSELSKNETLKEVLLKNTPWVLDAQSQEEQMHNLALLFDENLTRRNAERFLKKLDRMQGSGGGFSWFKGGRESRYITQYIVSSFTHLKRLGLLEEAAKPILQKAIAYLDSETLRDYEYMQRKNRWDDLKLPGSIQLHYLYARSAFEDISFTGEKTAEVYRAYMAKAEEHWIQANLFQKGLIAFASFANKHQKYIEIVASLKETAVWSEEMGMYWNENRSGYFWDQRNIETQSLLIALFDEVAKDQEAVEQMRIWLLQNKRTHHWDNTKSTAWAVYALMSGEGKEALKGERINMLVDGKKVETENSIDPMGRAVISFPKNKIKPALGELSFSNPNDHLAFASVYWQYFENLEAVKAFEEGPLKLKKKLFVQSIENGKEIWKPVGKDQRIEIGDDLLVRIEISSDRDLEYVHLKDSRASGMEPLGFKSGYRWNAGLGYYQSLQDSHVDFFLDRLNKGKHVLEYRLVASHSGSFSNGISNIQCMYAPEFSSHSGGMKLDIQTK